MEQTKTSTELRRDPEFVSSGRFSYHIENINMSFDADSLLM